jgi:chromosome segregation ATPase
MPEEWLTYREIGARLGLNVEAVRTRVRRAGWRTQPGNDGRTRVLVSDEVFVEPVKEGGHALNEKLNRTDDLTGLVALLTAAEARVSRLEGQLEAERDRVNEARSEVARLRSEMAELTARADRTEQASTAAQTEAAQLREAVTKADNDRAAAVAIADEAVRAAEELRQAAETRRGRGRWARLRAAWQ